MLSVLTQFIKEQAINIRRQGRDFDFSLHYQDRTAWRLTHSPKNK